MPNLAIELIARPDGTPGPEHFRAAHHPMPECPAGGLLVENLYLAVDPAMRGWISDEQNYTAPVPIGATMRAFGVGRVLCSDAPDWKAGDMVYGLLGWQRFAAIQTKGIYWKVDEAAAALPAWLSVLGMNGIAAWVGFNASRGQAGETLLVSTAAGGVGSLACQLGKHAGMTVIGLTSTEEKRRQCVDEYGCDAALNYRTVTDLEAAITQAAPAGIDVFFDNTAGWIADAVFPQMRVNGRIVQCGTASVPTWTPWPSGPRRERHMVVKRLSWTGFVAMDDPARSRAAIAAMLDLMTQGVLRHNEQIIDGLENAPAALAGLYRGENSGRVCIRP